MLFCAVEPLETKLRFPDRPTSRILIENYLIKFTKQFKGPIFLYFLSVLKICNVKVFVNGGKIWWKTLKFIMKSLLKSLFRILQIVLRLVCLG